MSPSPTCTKINHGHIRFGTIGNCVHGRWYQWSMRTQSDKRPPRNEFAKSIERSDITTFPTFNSLSPCCHLKLAQGIIATPWSMTSKGVSTTLASMPSTAVNIEQHERRALKFSRISGGAFVHMCVLSFDPPWSSNTFSTTINPPLCRPHILPPSLGLSRSTKPSRPLYTSR